MALTVPGIDPNARLAEPQEAISTVWDATPGRHLLRVRAHDQSGRSQPDVPSWNRGGFANNADQPVEVIVLESASSPAQPTMDG